MTAIGINGSVWGAQALLAHYDAVRGGAIVNMASPVAEKGFPNTAAYSLVKGAIVTLTKVLAAELGPRNVRVNAIAPGFGADARRTGAQRQGRIRATHAYHSVAPARPRRGQRRGLRIPAERRGVVHQRRNSARGRRHRRRGVRGAVHDATAIPEFDTDPFSRESVRNARAVDDRLRELAPVVQLPRRKHHHARALRACGRGPQGLEELLLHLAPLARPAIRCAPNCCSPTIRQSTPRVRAVVANALSPRALSHMAEAFRPRCRGASSRACARAKARPSMRSPTSRSRSSTRCCPT